MTESQKRRIEALGLTESAFAPQKDSNNEKLQALMDIISIDKGQSDKLGYDWEIIKVGNLEVQKKYIAQTNPVGTADNPIIYTEGVALINNAFYMKDGVRVVYMDGQFVEF